jgi:hypothetical protein
LIKVCHADLAICLRLVEALKIEFEADLTANKRQEFKASTGQIAAEGDEN